jgi:hypothetical protein
MGKLPSNSCENIAPTSVIDLIRSDALRRQIL